MNHFNNSSGKTEELALNPAADLFTVHAHTFDIL